MTNPQARAHIERYALSPRHRTIALALLESQDWDEREGVQWLVLANNIVAALDRSFQDQLGLEPQRVIPTDIDVAATLEVNGQQVSHCGCSPTAIAHWSYRDMEDALGRPLTSADLIRVRVESPGRTHFAAVNQ